MSDCRVPLEVFRRGVEDSGAARAHVGLRHGSMRVLLYAPRGEDPQTPHAQDEVYLVLSGSGRFRNGAETREFAAGDAIFVAAGTDHRFESFTEDFESWVVFWGPDGGELT